MANFLQVGTILIALPRFQIYLQKNVKLFRIDALAIKIGSETRGLIFYVLSKTIKVNHYD